MKAESERDLRARGLVRLSNQTHLLAGGTKERRAQRLTQYEWLEGLGVPLRQCGDCPCGNVWGPRWLDVLESCFKGSNVVGIGVSRALRDPVWAEALLAAYALDGQKGVAALIRDDA